MIMKAMKNYISAVMLLLIGTWMLTGCEKELMDYEGKDALYFDVRRSASWIEQSKRPHQYYSAVAFGNMMEDEIELSLKVMATGNIKNYDRAFQVIANPDSTTAVNGRDYTDLTTDCVIKAGENSTNVTLKVKRSAEMKDDTLQLQLKIVENNMFSLPFTQFGDGPQITIQPDKNEFSYNKDASVHNIFIYDVLTRPERWIGNDENGLGLWGRFSAKKYRLIMELTGTTIEDFATEERMPMARQQSIDYLMSKYLLEKAKNHEPVLEDDGTMMYFSAIADLDASSAWMPFTKPEDYYK